RPHGDLSAVRSRAAAARISSFTTRLTAGSGRREHEVPSSAAVRALTVPSNSSEFGQTLQFRQGPDSSRRGYYSVRSVVRRRRHAARGEAADHFAPPLLHV